jgi:carbamoyltransferase
VDSDLYPASFGAPRKKDEPLEARHQVIAFSLQKAVERVVLRLLDGHARKWRTRNLCIAGGVGLNCALNGVIDRTGMFDRIFVQPAAGDAGAALGAALAAYHEDNRVRPASACRVCTWGPRMGKRRVRAALQEFRGRA